MSAPKSNKKINTNTNLNIKQGKNMRVRNKQKKFTVKTLEANKYLDNTNINSINSSKQRRVATYLAIGLPAILAMVILPEIAVASKFDINAGVAAATTPLIQAVNDHWGKAVLLTGCAGAVIGEGDARQRAVRAAITATAAGGVILALLAMLT